MKCQAAIVFCAIFPLGLNASQPVEFMNVQGEGQGGNTQKFYYGQAAKDGVIELNATNGFFDRCFQAGAAKKVTPENAKLIKSNFDYLEKGREELGSARWHLWMPEAGEVKLEFVMTVPISEHETTWNIRMGEQLQVLKANTSDGKQPQTKTLTFNVKKPGKHSVEIDCQLTAPAADTRIHRIMLSGDAINNAHLLRARWRPAAAHCRYQAPAECPSPKMWVFETVATTPASSYSPITTPFGYYGTSLSSEGKVAKGAGFNFSMWAVSMGADKKAPPIQQMPRLIGTGLPDASYSSFGHEGTGVKFRNAVAYPNGADRIIQAMRVETQDGITTYYAYFYNETSQRWVLYGSGQKPVKNRRKGETDELRSTGSFCEVPGPPNVERSGDVKRVIKRRGWFYGSDKKWYRAALSTPSRKETQARSRADEALKTGGDPHLDSEQNYYANDYVSQGWMVTATGGMENFLPLQRREEQLKKSVEPAPLPEYLNAETSTQLFDLPVVFGASKTTKITETSATVDYPIIKTGPDSKAILYYGALDCLSFTANEAQRGSNAQKEIFSKDRTWQSHTAERSVKEGTEKFVLTDLKSNTAYFYRLFVSHDEGKSWDYQSGSFKTR
ncbi:hypothetical protein NT6N_16770 [Oceaniferula spumae]|uniref:Fibronectin type-III domain-containing protein n=1 Tax=Oceaniferula spumae TaxID=2979115 RepID=A0AAT9FKL3_9BACT